MMLPDLSSKNREKDIQVSNFTITYGGHELLDGADLRLAYGRRYGLVGRNGIGKTTLLKHMATFDIEGFPKHHRVLHVKQEVSSSSKSVLEVVLESDALLSRQKEAGEDSSANSDKMQEIIGAASAESRAAEILHGLRFTEKMQMSSTDSLSGGWRMRVALAGALFIQPDLLMLDEPTNHLDLEAVLWLEQYLQTYPHTILLVSHDRAFLNEVCNDIIRFADKKLTYFRGNYDRQHEAQKAKIAHMQEFVDKFRFNANRAALVQSRIKAIERETVIDAVVEEAEFKPIVQIDSVTFGFGETPLFKNVHLNLDQQSRVALVGPNGAGKSTLLNLVQNRLTPWEGLVRINPSLRIGSALENMSSRWPLTPEQDLRSHLGSGGQKSRVAFAVLTFTKPHIFTGGVLVISHDQHFISSVCSEIWQIKDHSIQTFNGSF
eukprot:GSChrysophyteH1.ASY1.ANO1.433.1 assembled CDS